jgi:MFS family permease
LTPDDASRLTAIDPPERPTAYRYWVLASLASSAMVAYLTRVCIAPAGTTIQAELGLDDVRIGAIHGAWTLGYVWLQVPGGWLGDRLGRRLVLPLLAVAWSLCTLWSARATTFESLWWSRFAFGVAQAGLIPNVARVLVDWFPVARRGVNTSLFTSSMSVGAVVASGLTAQLLPVLGWRGVLRAYSVVGLAWAWWFAVAFRNRPEDHPRVNRAEAKLIRGPQPAPAPAAGPHPDGAAEPRAARAGLLRLMLASASLRALFAQEVFRAGGYAFFISWFPAYMERGHGLRVEQAGMLTMLPLAGVVAGSLLGGFVIDALLRWTGSKRISRSGVAGTALALSGLGMLAALFTAGPWTALAVITAGAFCSGMAAPATWATLMDLGGTRVAIVAGTTNMFGNLGAFLSPVAVGALLERYPGHWNLVLILFAAIYLAGAGFWLLVDPERPIVADESAVRLPNPSEEHLRA